MVDRIFIEDEVLRAGFTQIPNTILRRPDITPGAKLTYMVLLSYAWQEGSCFPGQERMAEDMGVSRRSIVTYLQQLEEAGLIVVIRRGLNKTNVYVLPKAGSANFAHQEVQKTAHPEMQILHPKNTQRNRASQRKNRKDTQFTDDEREAYYRQMMEENAEQLRYFFDTDNHDTNQN